LPYFRCLLIKKTYNSIKESQWQTIKDVVEEWGLSSVFTFKVSPFTIECENGNRFIARGCDDPQSIKGVKDPSHALV
jgi:phage terminase large subunit